MKILLPLVLKQIKGIGVVKARSIIENNVLPTTIEDVRDWIIDIIAKDGLANYKIDNEQFKRIIDKANNIKENSINNSINILSILDDRYPILLKQIHDAPILLYYKGKYESLINEKIISIVGTRYPTSNGERVADKTSKYFSTLNYSIVSGLAIGCDTYVHKASLEMKNSTIAVMPCGLDNIIPKVNMKLADDILNNNGCLVSEHELGMKVFKYNYVKRNRIQSGLSKGVVVIETPKTGGTIETIKFALQQNRLIGCYNSEKEYENILGNLEYINAKKAIGYKTLNELEIIEKMIRNYNVNTVKQLNFNI